MLDDLHQPERGIAITFILPTRNRREWVARAIDSCLAVAGPAAAVEVLVVDGRSTDGSFEALGRLYGADPRVRLIRQEAGGDFMDACFSAIPLVRTPFATFMYDDDVLSPRWAEMPLDLLDGRARFAMGKGEVGEVAATLVFPPAVRRISVDPASLLRSYCGCNPRTGRLGLPVSPICCLTLTARLRDANALRHTPQDGRIILDLTFQNNYAQLSVHDSGPGIPNEALPHVFERFYRGDKSRSRSEGGSGLGLAIARQLAESHGGLLTANNHPQGGAVFTLQLPLHPK